MMNKLKTILLTILCLSVALVAAEQPHQKISTQQYIETYRNEAIRDMKRTGVPASITLAQGILESQSGNSRLAREANNHFGIKCHNGWKGGRIYKDDDRKNECFRKYPSVLDSYNDHSRFLRERSRYAFLFEYRTTDYKAWAKGLKKAGYATNPKYASHLIRIIEQYDLDQYDKGGKRVPLDKKVEYPEQRYDRDPAPVASKGASTTSTTLINHNDVPYLIAEKGDTYYSIASENDMMLWQVLKYNDAMKGDILSVGEKIYLKPKRGRAAVQSHTVASGETMRHISQEYGVKQRKLYKLNRIEPGSPLEKGQLIRLR